MLDMMSALRRIKPVGSTEDYISGTVAIDERGLTRNELGELFSARVLAALSKDKGKCTKQVTLLAGGSHPATAKKLRKLELQGVVTYEKKLVGSNTKPTHFYTLVA